MEKIEVINFDMFAGYGGAEFGFDKAGIKHKCVGFSEIDKRASECFVMNHGEIKNYGDARNIDPKTIPHINFLTGGFPCQSFSSAGKGLGELDTRGTLFHEIIRIAEELKPDYMLLENVKGLTFNKHKLTLKKIISELKRIGDYVRWQLFNSMDFGTPQSRERIWFACFRNVHEAENFKWPEKEELKIFVKDLLEDDVEGRYFLSKKLQDRFQEYIKNKKPADIYQTGKFEDKKGFRAYNKVSPTLVGTGHDAYTIPLVVAQRKRESGQEFEERKDGCTNAITSVSKDNYIYDTNVSQTIVSTIYKGDAPKRISNGDLKSSIVYHGKLRKLTPKECFRLMGFFDDEIKLEGIPKTHQYRLAGNGWEINIVSKIMKAMLCQK